MFSKKIKTSISRRTLAVIAVIALSLSVSGLASLATIHQELTSMTTATAATINAAVNGTQTLTTDYGVQDPGSVVFQPLTFTNTGTAYAQVPTISGKISETLYTADTLRQVYTLANGVQCTAAGLTAAGIDPATSWGTPSVATPLSAPLWPRPTVTGGGDNASMVGNEFQILPNQHVNLCVVYRFGASGTSYPLGQTMLQVEDAFHVYFPAS